MCKVTFSSNERVRNKTLPIKIQGGKQDYHTNRLVLCTTIVIIRNIKLYLMKAGSGWQQLAMLPVNIYPVSSIQGSQRLLQLQYLCYGSKIKWWISCCKQRKVFYKGKQSLFLDSTMFQDTSTVIFSISTRPNILVAFLHPPFCGSLHCSISQVYSPASFISDLIFSISQRLVRPTFEPSTLEMGISCTIKLNSSKAGPQNVWFFVFSNFVWVHLFPSSW